TRFSRDWSSDVCSSDLTPRLQRILQHKVPSTSVMALAAAAVKAAVVAAETNRHPMKDGPVSWMDPAPPSPKSVPRIGSKDDEKILLASFDNRIDYGRVRRECPVFGPERQTGSTRGFRGTI